MLVITRKPGESVSVGEDIYVTILEVYGHNQVRIGIQAPKYIKVDRTEVRERRRRKNLPLD